MNTEMETLIGLTIEEKIKKSKEIIKEALAKYTHDDLYIAWTGGKDSTTVLWLIKESCKEVNIPMPKAMFIDEGNVFEEILELVEKIKREWNIELSIVKNTDVSNKAKKVGNIIRVADLNERNQEEIGKLGITDDTFHFEPESFIGNHLMKTVAMNVFIETKRLKALVTAIRWDEQESRVKEDFFSPRSNPEHTRIHPILHFKERDIWNTIHKFKIPFCSLYYQGYRSLGAKGSTIKMSEIPAWEQDLENTTERSGRGQEKERIMDQLRSLGYM